MLCTKCGKNEANIYFSRTINGEKTEYNLCPRCAKEMDIEKAFSSCGRFIQNNFFSSPLLHSSLFEDFGFTHKKLFDNDFFSLFSGLPAPEKTCPYCGGTFEKFKETGKFGCAMCYETFKDKMDEGFLDTKPSQQSKDDKINNLKAKIEDAVKAERYEDAAKFRDEIRALESGK